MKVLKALVVLWLSLVILGGASPSLAQEYLGVVLGVKDKNNLAPPGQKKVTVGKVSQVTGSKILIENDKAARTETVLDQETKIVGQNKKTLRLSQIQINDKVAIISSDSASLATDAGELKAVKVYIGKTASKRRAIQGVVSSIGDNLITLTHQIQTDRISQVAFNRETQVRVKGVAEATIADLKVGQRIIAVGDLDESSLLATRIFAIPGKAIGIDRQSAEPTASQSATITPTSQPPSPTATASATVTY